MKKYVAVWAAAVLFIFASGVSLSASDITWDDIGRGNLNLRVVLIAMDNPRLIYIGSDNAVLKSEDAGETWRNILSIRGQNRRVNFLCLDPKDKNSIYAATGNGLFYSANQGKSWNRIFKGKNFLENECTAIAPLPGAIYLGTKAGLFVSSDNGRSWHKESANLGNSQILAIVYDAGPEQNNSLQNIYLACADGVFKNKGGGQSWERVFIAHPQENQENDDIEEEDEVQDEGAGLSNIRYLAIDPNNPNYLYLSTSGGVYKTEDRGLRWELFSNFGLLNRDVRFLFVSSQSYLYAVTKSGIFEYINNRWQELSLGLAVEEIRFLAQGSSDNLYAACDKGLFKARIKYTAEESKSDLISFYQENEPTISEIQQVAVRYAEVEPEKIKEWRRKAKIKAILPKLTVGLDKSESSNYEIYTSATTRYIYEGPNDKSNGWDVTLSWDFSELIWNDAQTSIDVRSRLMVELRDDILDEVTKLYFERLRVKIEMDNLAIEAKKKRLEKRLRLEELTASLDALTGGYFSRNIKK